MALKIVDGMREPAVNSSSVCVPNGSAHLATSKPPTTEPTEATAQKGPVNPFRLCRCKRAVNEGPELLYDNHDVCLAENIDDSRGEMHPAGERDVAPAD